MPKPSFAFPLRPFAAADVPAAAALCAAAFEADPGFAFVAPEGPAKRPFLERLYRENLLMDLDLRARGFAAEIDGRLAGLTLWFPPGARKPGVLSWLARLPRLLPLLRHPRSAWRGLVFQGAIDAAFPKDERDLAYFKLLAVHPAFHGAGVGSALLQKAIAETPGWALYLETATASNAAFYAKRGFAELPPIEGAGRPTLRRMRRTPS